MKIKMTADSLIKIEQLKDIISIDYKELFITGAKEKAKIIPGFLVVYGNMEQLFLTTNDVYFEEFVRELRETYLEEKDNIIREGIFGPEKIQISPLTQTILLSGELEKGKSSYEFYRGKSSYQESLLFEEDHLQSFFKIIEYHLRETLKRWNFMLGKTTLSEGCNGTYFLSTTMNNDSKIIPIQYRQENGEYHIEFGNLLDRVVPLKMNIRFTKDGIQIHNTIEEYEYSDYFTYLKEQKVPKFEREIIHKGNIIHFQKENLEEIEKPNSVVTFDNTVEKVNWFQLPWNAYLGIETDDVCIKEDGTIGKEETKDHLEERRMIYLYSDENTYYAKEKYTKRYYKKIPTGVVSESIIFDFLDKTTIGIKGDKTLIETSFYPQGVTGFYKTNLSSNYFYHLSDEKDWSNLTSDNITPIGREDGVEEKQDLWNHTEYQKRREENGLI